MGYETFLQIVVGQLHSRLVAKTKNQMPNEAKGMTVLKQPNEYRGEGSKSQPSFCSFGLE